MKIKTSLAYSKSTLALLALFSSQVIAAGGGAAPQIPGAPAAATGLVEKAMGLFGKKDKDEGTTSSTGQGGNNTPSATASETPLENIMPGANNPSPHKFMKRARKSKEDYIKNLKEKQEKTKEKFDKITDENHKKMAEAAMAGFDIWMNAMEAYQNPKAPYAGASRSAMENLILINRLAKIKPENNNEDFPAGEFNSLKNRLDEIKNRIFRNKYGEDNRKTLEAMTKSLEKYLSVLGDLKGKKSNYYHFLREIYREIHALELFAHNRKENPANEKK